MDDRLKIAMVVRAFATDGGLELYTYRLTEGLLARGHEVSIFCQSKRAELEHPNISFNMIAGRSDNLAKLFKLRHDSQAGNISMRARQSEFDIIHSQHYPGSFANVVTFHNHTVRRWSSVGLPAERMLNDLKSSIVPAYLLRNQQDGELCRRASCLVFPSHLMQQDFYRTYPELSIQQKPSVVAYPGASVPVTSEFVDDWKRPANAPFTFLFVGRGFRKKGLDIVLAAVAKLARTGRYFRLLIAGLEAKPIDLIRMQLMGLQNHVQYLGFRNDMDVVYRMADAAILPSRVEPFGMAPLQAMNFGLVPIISRVSGVSEVLQHDHDCLIVENHVDVDELVSHMARLMDQPRLLAELSLNARQAARKINWEQTVDRTLDAYAIARRVPAKVGATVQ